MAKKKVKKAAKKVVKKVLDKTQIDEKIVAEYKENQSIYDTILCHCKCYGGYVLAIGAGCTFGVNIWYGLALMVGAGIWAYKVNCACKPCKKDKDVCCNG